MLLNLLHRTTFVYGNGEVVDDEVVAIHQIMWLTLWDSEFLPHPECSKAAGEAMDDFHRSMAMLKPKSLNTLYFSKF